ncbi:putative ABC-type branched-chain amino acid transporter, atp_binding component [Burkholderiales bacterium]|nr:putative ABC-type branched-chain amino acid transporter, atp_binding component [Burkholderiales bacterium]
MSDALELHDLHKSFGRTKIIHGVSLTLVEGERHALIGPNGAGKSTLFNLISGRLAPDSGRILLRGVDITGRSPFEIYRRGLSRSFQITNIFHHLTVFENLRCAVLWSLGYRYSFWRRLEALANARAAAENLIERIGLSERRDAVASSLTYAEQRALELGITIAGGSPVVLLDEPTAGMSRSETERTIGLLRRVTEGRTLLMVEHDMDVVFGLAERISVMVYGRIIASGTPEQIHADARVREAYLGTAEAEYL